jgi:hypothetical protein
MERMYKVMVFLDLVKTEDDGEETLRESIKDALRHAIEADDLGDEGLDYTAEELEET